ncbi:DeoR/GlpR family DNA-binding transcription regulator [Homoserinibacter sp. YIM 151385]|uniref:DeoR/GlpR family DNA-binding transcription regulator n=1 Tax=Homoserinibacter sp. YIM 151385 TaxID=2985506 RepID=UPI0022F14454|nr:DeoR/GlpR family DNA-binding transcription regulator [Homoserinibacter sp. YIM 151385]WBU37983.1 DeoR/GlpR family DNA-binding transcription regulator [Homoserinibacter sp. YIM 151385]
MTARRTTTTEGRRRRIVELTAEAAFLRPTDIAEQLGVSAETIRRDLVALEEGGQLRRVHGGALALDVAASEPSRTDRSSINQDQKLQIAAIVAGLVAPSDIVFMDVGTTIETAAQQLAADFVGTVVTNSLAVGAALNERREVELHLLGGRVRVGEMTTYGSDALAQLRTFNASVAFIGSGGIDLEAGMTDFSSEDVEIKRTMLSRASRTYILATSDKFGTQAMRSVCSLDEVDGIVTDAALDAAVLAEYEEAGVTVLTPGRRP